MDKVYIVTAGCYSDYYIAKCFKDKEKASRYAKCIRDAGVEEYDLSDDVDIRKINELSINLIWYTTGVEEQKCSWGLPCEYDSCVNDTIFSDYSDKNFYSPHWELSLYRYIEGENIDKDFYERKFKKAAYDIQAQIKGWLAEGVSETQINEWLRGENKIEE